MIGYFTRMFLRAANERQLRETRERIRWVEDALASGHEELQRLREKERRLSSRLLLSDTPDQIVRRAGVA